MCAELNRMYLLPFDHEEMITHHLCVLSAYATQLHQFNILSMIRTILTHRIWWRREDVELNRWLLCRFGDVRELSSMHEAKSFREWVQKFDFTEWDIFLFHETIWNRDISLYILSFTKTFFFSRPSHFLFFHSMHLQSLWDVLNASFRDRRVLSEEAYLSQWIRYHMIYLDLLDENHVCLHPDLPTFIATPFPALNLTILCFLFLHRPRTSYLWQSHSLVGSFINSLLHQSTQPLEMNLFFRENSTRYPYPNYQSIPSNLLPREVPVARWMSHLENENLSDSLSAVHASWISRPISSFQEEQCILLSEMVHHCQLESLHLEMGSFLLSRGVLRERMVRHFLLGKEYAWIARYLGMTLSAGKEFSVKTDEEFILFLVRNIRDTTATQSSSPPTLLQKKMKAL